MAQTIRVQLVEENDLAEAGLRCLLNEAPEIMLLPHVACDNQCANHCVQAEPDVIIMDMSFHAHCCLDCIRRILSKAPDIRILALGSNEDLTLPRMALQTGASGYIGRESSADMLLLAVNELAQGRRYVEPQTARLLEEGRNAGSTRNFDALSHREYEIMQMMLDGKSTKQIADILHISSHTVANHHTQIIKKMNVVNLVELTRMAIRQGLISA